MRRQQRATGSETAPKSLQKRADTGDSAAVVEGQTSLLRSGSEDEACNERCGDAA